MEREACGILGKALSRCQLYFYRQVLRVVLPFPLRDVLHDYCLNDCWHSIDSSRLARPLLVYYGVDSSFDLPASFCLLPLSVVVFVFLRPCASSQPEAAPVELGIREGEITEGQQCQPPYQLSSAQRVLELLHFNGGPTQRHRC